MNLLRLKKMISLVGILTVFMLLIPLNSYAVMPVPESNGLHAPYKTVASMVTFHSVKVSWKRVVQAKGYFVYYKTGGKKKYSLKKLESGKKTSCLLKNLKKRRKYSIRVVPYKYKKHKKVFGAASALRGYTCLARPVYSDRTANGKRIISQWKTQDAKAGILVYRSDSAKGKFKRLGSSGKRVLVPVKDYDQQIAPAAAVRFSDKTTKPRKTYYYKVRSFRAIRGKRIYSRYSRTKAISSRNTSPAFKVKKATLPGDAGEALALSSVANNMRLIFEDGLSVMSYSTDKGKTWKSSCASFVLKPGQVLYLRDESGIVPMSAGFMLYCRYTYKKNIPGATYYGYLYRAAGSGKAVFVSNQYFF